MIEVAYASGYGSVRRFNEAFQLMFGRPPAALRRRPIGLTAPAGVLSLQLSFAPPYDWRAMMDRLARRAIAGVECVEPNAYRRTIDVDGAKGADRCVARVDDGGRLRVDLRVGRLDALPQIITRIRALFDLAADPLVLAERLGGDAALSSLVTAKPGLRAPGCWDTFELIVRTIFGERLIATAVAGSLMREFVRAFGEPAGLWGRAHALFPIPETDPLRRRSVECCDDGPPVGRYRFLCRGGAGAGDPGYGFRAHRGDDRTGFSALAGFDREMAVTIATRLAELDETMCRASRRSHIALIDKCRPVASLCGHFIFSKLANWPLAKDCWMPPDALCVDRVASPIGAIQLVFDDAGVLRALDSGDHEERIASAASPPL